MHKIRALSCEFSSNFKDWDIGWIFLSPTLFTYIVKTTGHYHTECIKRSIPSTNPAHKFRYWSSPTKLTVVRGSSTPALFTPSVCPFPAGDATQNSRDPLSSQKRDFPSKKGLSNFLTHARIRPSDAFPNFSRPRKLQHCWLCHSLRLSLLFCVFSRRFWPGRVNFSHQEASMIAKPSKCSKPQDFGTPTMVSHINISLIVFYSIKLFCRNKIRTIVYLVGDKMV